MDVDSPPHAPQAPQPQQPLQSPCPSDAELAQGAALLEALITPEGLRVLMLDPRLYGFRERLFALFASADAFREVVVWVALHMPASQVCSFSYFIFGF